MSGATVRLDRAAFAWEDMAMLFDADIGAGDIVAVMGPSGAGKSTLLNLVAGFEQPVSGRVLIRGQDMAGLGPGERPVSMVFQENNLFGHLDLFANVALGRSPALRLSASDRTDIMAAIARAGLEGKEKRRPAELSGGERQRAALARAALRDRPVLLLDEPFAALDPALRSDMLELLAELHRQSGMTVLVVTHQPADALALNARVLFIESGRIAADGPAAFLLGDNAPEAMRRYRGLD